MTHQKGITSRQAICIIALYTYGSSAIFGIAAGAGNDAWIAILSGLALDIPVVCLYARIIRLYPQTGLYDIIINVFGKIAGRGIVLLFVLYSINLGSAVLRNFSEFVEISSMPETPQLPILITMMLVIVYIVSNGIQVLGKWCAIAFPITAAIVLLSLLLAYKQMDFENIYPIAHHDIGTMALATWRLFSFPFAENVLFLALASSLRKSDNPDKIYVLGISIGGIILLFIFFRNLFVLGESLLESDLFPAYTTIRIATLSDFLQRMEATISTNFYLGGITKIAVCLFSATIGAARLFYLKSFKKVILPTSIIMLVVAVLIFQSVFQMLNYAENIYMLYAPLFQVVLPAAIWIGAEVKTRKDKAKSPKTYGGCHGENEA